MSLRLKRVLYRSFLRWNRSPAVVNSNFSIDPSELGIASLLPLSVRSIKNKEGVHGAISYCFRNSQNPATVLTEIKRGEQAKGSDQIDLAFGVLKKLNTFGQKLKDLYNRRLKNSSQDVYSKAVYHVGQTLCHTESSCRCVVIGWDIDVATGHQMVECLADLGDIDEMVSTGSHYPGPEELHDSVTFSLVTDPSLKRIYHPSLLSYFKDYDVVNEVFNPTDEVAYLYPHDSLKAKAAMQKARALERSLSSLDGATGQIVAGGIDDSVQLRQSERRAAQSVLTSVGALGAQLETIINKHDARRAEAVTATLNLTMDNSSASEHERRLLQMVNASLIAESKELGDLASREDTVRSVMGDIVQCVKRCAAFTAGDLTSPLQPAPADDADEFLLPFEKSILRSQTESSTRHALKYANWRKNSMEKLLLNNALEAEERSSSAGLAQLVGRGPALRHRGTSTAEEASEALEALTSCYLSIDQMLQLRFQKNGSAHFETLEYMLDESRRESAAAEAEAVEAEAEASILPVDTAHTNSDEDIIDPGATYEVGQIMLHKKFGYRCVVNGWDIRPLADVSKWEAVVGSVHGSEQPFYRVIADEDDVQRFLGEGQFRSTYYVAQENLLPIPGEQLMPPEGSEQSGLGGVIKHRHLPIFFTSYDKARQRYGVPSKLKFCFPQQPKSDTAPVDVEVALARETEAEAFKAVELVLLEMYFLLKGSFSRTNAQPCSLPAIDTQHKGNKKAVKAFSFDLLRTGKDSSADVTAWTGGDRDPLAEMRAADLQMKDLLCLLKVSNRRDVAATFESTIWHAWMAHTDPLVNKAMRLGVSNLIRGDMVSAHDNFTEASLLDPFYPEAHNKLAAMYHKTGQYSECAKRAQIALALCPSHYGALAGLGMSLEKAGNISGALTAFRQSLDHHPWAGHVPTVLWNVMVKEKKREKQEKREREEKREKEEASHMVPKEI